MSDGMIVFGSMEELLAYQEKMAEAADKAIFPTQRAMKPGSYWIRPVDHLGIFVWGYWPTIDEIVADEREAGATVAEAEYVRQHEAEKAERGYMFGTAYSTITPEGELGTTHASIVWPITKEEFEKAQAAVWEIGVGDPPLIARWFVLLLDRIAREMDAEANGVTGPLINIMNLLLILTHPEWHEPADADEG